MIITATYVLPYPRRFCIDYDAGVTMLYDPDRRSANSNGWVKYGWKHPALDRRLPQEYIDWLPEQ